MKKQFWKRAAALLGVLALLAGLCACGKSDAESKAQTETQGEGLFDTSFVHTVNVEISEEDWADLLANPLEKTKYAVNVTIDGETVENVSFATKGNTTLSQVASSDSDRYSFKINFHKYVKGQSYHGLDKLNLNNVMSDATYLKDYLSYLIMREAGVSAPLTSYVQLYINGELHGLYLAVEDVADEFLERNYGSADGALYKPETDSLDNMAGGPNGMERPEGMEMPEGMEPPDGMEMPEGMERPDAQSGATPDTNGMERPEGMEPPEGMELPEGMEPPDGMDFGGMQMPGGFGSGNAEGADLVYQDDEVSSYGAIFDNEETEVSDEDRQELIAALQSLQDGSAGAHWDMDEVTRYFAAHNLVLNFDSYTGSMLHNYYLYEEDGIVSILPWDYNLAFGGFQNGDATSAVNYPIDEPLSGATEDSRPLWKAVAESEETLAAYHAALDELLTGFFESGRCEAEIQRVYEMLRPYVAEDPSAFYTVEEFDAAVQTLKDFCSLRAESVRRQLDGTLGATSQTQNDSDKVDASSLTLSDMGSQGGGRGGENGFPGGQNGFPGGQNGFPGGQGGRGERPGGQNGFPGGQGGRSERPDGQNGFPEGQGGFPGGQGDRPGEPGEAPADPEETDDGIDT